MIKSVAVFGASSKTGECVVNAAVKKGLNVRVLLDYRVERPKGLAKTVEVVEGDVLDIQHVKTTLEGQDAVVVLYGSYENQDSSSVTCEGLKNIVAVMELLNIKAVSICFPAQTVSRSIQRAMNVLEQDRSRMTRILESSTLHWIAVVVPCVTDNLATGYAVVRDHCYTTKYTPVSRPDLAAFLVDCLNMPERYQKIVEIASFAKR